MLRKTYVMQSNRIAIEQLISWTSVVVVLMQQLARIKHNQYHSFKPCTAILMRSNSVQTPFEKIDFWTPITFEQNKMKKKSRR
jgi:hypothetical protein